MKIKFKIPKLLLDTLKDVYPVPATKTVPKWYKDLEHTTKERTAKGCLPFMDALTAGYILKLTYDLEVNHGVVNKDGKRISETRAGNPHREDPYLLSKHRAEVPPNHVEGHHPRQIKGSPLLKKNGHDTALLLKFKNPFRIFTPPGYSTLFVSPLNNPDDRFQIVSGVVDTDEWHDEINFPFIVNGDKYKVLETIITKGTPIAQCIPFKRDDWESKVEELIPYENEKTIHSMMLHTWKYYRNKFWKRKKCT